MADERRVYYDHEPAWRRIAAAGGQGWDDLRPGPDQGSYRALDAFLARSAPPAPGARALELGCGGGQAALRCARRGWRTAGIDYSETAIALARRNAAEAGLELELVVGDCLDLAAFPDGSMDLVVDNHLLHCLVTPAHRAALLRAVRRVLAPHGRWFSETMSCEGPFDPAAVDADPRTGIARNGTRVWVREADLDRELSAAGLVVVHRERSAPDASTGGCDLVTVAVPGP